VRLALLLLLLAVALAAGCGGAGSADAPAEETTGPVPPPDEEVTLGYVGWDESVALAHLTGALLEELGYEEVELRRLEEPEAIYQGVAGGELDAFQSVWLPTHEDLLGSVEDEVDLLDPWTIGSTRSSLAAPSYMGVRTLEGLRDSGAEKLVGVEPGAAPIETPGDLPRGYDLERDLYPSTTAMFEEVDRLYAAREPFVFLAYSPHWASEVYEFDYIEDPDRVFGDLTQPARIHTVVREDLRREDPRTYALLREISLAEYQLQSLELAIRQADSASQGAREWAAVNEQLTGRWLDAAVQQSSG
jgi:glycine betaine/proline transport system substrate-binding protein